MKFKGLAGMIALWMLGVFLLVAFAGWHLIEDVNTAYEQTAEIDAANRTSHDLHELELGLMSLVSEVQSFLVDGNEVHRKRFETTLRSFVLTLPREDAGLFRDLRAAVDDIANLAHQVFSLPFATGNMEGPILVQQIKERLARFSASLGAQHHELDEKVDASMQLATGLHMDIWNDLVGLIIVLFAVLAGLSFYLYSRLVQPLGHLRREVEQVAQGEFDLHCPELGRNELGDLARALNVMGDALKQRDEALAKARSLAAHHEKMHILAQVGAGIAHEIGNPLAASMISLEMAGRKLRRGDVAETENLISDALTEAHRIEDIVRNVLDFAGPDLNDMPGPFELLPVLESARRLASISPKKKLAKIRIDASPDLPAPCGISSMLLQVLVNLLLNAMDACRAQGLVTMRAGAESASVWVDVLDNGSGIPEEIRDEIFSPMFTTKEGRGTGLGLSISRDLMRRMNGDLYLAESGKHGSRFRVVMPASGSQACLC